jgi:TRAP-type C4-dicarboxylate transport system permease large subunit
MNPVHAGVMIVLTLNISLMTPPVGACIFVLSSVTGERIERISAALWPFILVEVGVLFITTFWTDLAMFFPKLLLDM